MPASSKNKPGWRPNTLSKVSTTNAKDISPRIAEPQHRLGSAGVSSGISTRVQTSACVAEVRKICQHYVRKTSGKYVDNVTAARYIHQMAEDVLSQLADVSAEIKRHESHPEMYQELLDSWNEVFPPSLGEIGTPRAIANKVKAQTVEIEQLKLQVSELERNRQSELQNLKESMDMQLQQSRDSILNERRQLIVTHKSDTEALIEAYEKERNQAKEERKALAKHFKEIVENLNVKFQQLESSKEKEKNELGGKLQEEKNSVMEQLNIVTQKFNALKEQSKSKLEQMKKKSRTAREMQIAEVRAQQNQPMIHRSNSIAGDNESIVSSIVIELDDAELSIGKPYNKNDDESISDEEWKKYLSESDDDDDDDEETEEDARDIHTGAVLKGTNMGGGAKGDKTTDKKISKKRLAKIEAAKQKAKEAKKQPNPVQIKGAVALKIQKLVDEQKQLKEACESKDEAVKMMKLDIEKLKIEVMYQKNRADGVDEINKNLRSTNFSPESNDGSTTITYKRIRKTVPVIKRTPHLLMHTKELKLK